MVKKCFIGILLACAATLLYGAERIPEPQGWVNDYADVISPEYREKITFLCRELEEKTSSEITVVTVSSIAPHDEKEYVRALFDRWKPGKRGKDNGAIILLAVKERRWRIETGYGLEGILPDRLCGEIGRSYMVPHFKEARYGEGLYYGAAAIADVIAKAAKTSLDGLSNIKFSAQNNELILPPFAVLLIGLFILVLIIYVNQNKGLRNYGYGGGFGGGFGGGGSGGGGFGGFGGGGGGGGGAGGGF